jgi:hypothetical protein
MYLYGCLSYIQRPGNIFIRLALRNKLQNSGLQASASAIMRSLYSGLKVRRERFSNNGSGVTCVSGRSDSDFGMLCVQ